VFAQDDCRPTETNTWGDSVVAFFEAQTYAVRCALTLRDIFRRKTHSKAKDLRHLKVRIALHTGEVFVGYDPVRQRTGAIGTEINRAARLEPVVPSNHVYATRNFVNLCGNNVVDVHFKSLGKVMLAKGWGMEEIYVVGWSEDEFLDVDRIKAIMNKSLDYQQGVLLYPPSTQWGARLLVSRDAKSNIAEYCIESDFWKPNEVVFIESGTLPFFMICALYRHGDSAKMPQFLITNNLACSMATMMTELASDEIDNMYPQDKLTDCVLTGGHVLPDYAATIPNDLIPDELADVDKSGFWQSNRITEYFNNTGVSHVIMMVSR
jgi:hypothetical protein